MNNKHTVMGAFTKLEQSVDKLLERINEPIEFSVLNYPRKDGYKQVEDNVFLS